MLLMCRVRVARGHAEAGGRVGDAGGRGVEDCVDVHGAGDIHGVLLRVRKACCLIFALDLGLDVGWVSVVWPIGVRWHSAIYRADGDVEIGHY